MEKPTRLDIPIASGKLLAVVVGTNMKFRPLVISAILAALTGCVQAVQIQTQFDPLQHEYANKKGTAVVNGQAFMRRNDGIVVYAAGSPVYLMPSTPYTQEMYTKAAAAYMPVNITNADQRLAQYIRRSQANGEGRFSFSGVPDGSYILVTTVNWMAGDSQQGGDLTQLITVSDGKSLDVIMTR